MPLWVPHGLLDPAEVCPFVWGQDEEHAAQHERQGHNG
jgi:hypothetical protein